jgi:ABC-type Fe3+ transport system substrate-binding protein
MSDGPQATALGKFVMLLFVVGCLVGAWYFLAGPGAATGNNSSPESTSGGDNNSSAKTTAITIAYGTEKKPWMEWAVKEFSKTSAGRDVSITLLPLGSLEGAQTIIRNDKPIHAWAPASSAFTNTFIADWQVKFGGDPIAKSENLALTPMVYVWWKERHQAFIAKYQHATVQTISSALQEKTGWSGIANKPEWGLFKFGHTHPGQSNSGLMALILLACEYHNKAGGLSMADILDANFQTWFATTESAVTGMVNSTGTMMKEMVLKGPSAYDCVLVYESVAIDFLKAAAGRWGDLQLVYPQRNVWNDNPFYVLNASWVAPTQRQAAEAFLAFLMEEPAQKQALVHGFRPGNPNVPVLFPESPFQLFQRNGLRNDISAVLEMPKSDVVTNLLQSWQRSQSGR